MNFVQRWLVRLLVGKAEGKLSQLEGWRTKVGAGMAVLAGLSLMLPGVTCGLQVIAAGDVANHLDAFGPCWDQILKGVEAMSVGVIGLGLRRAVGKIGNGGTP